MTGALKDSLSLKAEPAGFSLKTVSSHRILPEDTSKSVSVDR